MAVGSNKVDTPGVEEDGDLRTSFTLNDHTADQETATDEPVMQPDSSTADPNKTGRY